MFSHNGPKSKTTNNVSFRSPGGVTGGELCPVDLVPSVTLNRRRLETVLRGSLHLAAEHTHAYKCLPVTRN